MLSNLPLRLKIVLLTVVSVFLPIFLIGCIFCYKEVLNIYNSNATHLYNSAVHVKKDIDDVLRVQKSSIDSVAESEIVREMCTKLADPNISSQERRNTFKNFATQIDSANYAMPMILDISLANCKIYKTEKDKNYTVGDRIFFSTDSSDIGRLWRENGLKNFTWEQIVELNSGHSILDSRRNVQTYVRDNAPESSQDRNINTTSYIFRLVYKEPSTNKHIAILDGEKHLDFDNRTPVAVLIFEIKPLQGFLSHDNFYIIDNFGQIISAPRYVKENDLKNLSQKVYFQAQGFNHKTFYARQPNGQDTLPFLLYKNYLKATKDASKIQLEEKDCAIKKPYIDIFGNRVIGAWSPCQDVPWFVVCEIEERLILSSLHKDVLFSIFVILSVAVAFVFLAHIISKDITEPILKLNGAAQRIASGKHTQVDTDRLDEIGQLSLAFNIMSNQIESNIADLKKARDQAIEASQTKSRFLANMSHELRTPLNAIIGYSEMLMEDAKERDDQDSLEDSKNIHIAGVNLLGIINDILNISKLEANKVELFVERFSLEDLLLEVKASVNSLTIANSNTFNISTIQDNIKLYTDRAKIRQILINLISNALKFTKEGHINLILDIISADEANQEIYKIPYLDTDGQIIVPHEFIDKVIVFSVQDNGIGMNREQCQRIFEEFTQADNTITRSYGGTGLGLALVRHFSDMLFCRLELTSKPGCGSAFTIKMPLEWLKKEASSDSQ